MTADDPATMPVVEPTIEHSRWGLTASAIWGLVLSFAVCRTFFLAEHDL